MTGYIRCLYAAREMTLRLLSLMYDVNDDGKREQKCTLYVNITSSICKLMRKKLI